MTFTAFIACIIISIFLFILYFRISTKRISAEFGKREALLNEKIGMHTDQIKCRMGYLNRYDFAKYNLNSALVVQDDIIV